MLVTRHQSPDRAVSRTRSSRRGFTLAEMIVALVLFTIVGGGIMTIVMRQQRFYRSTADIIKQHGQLRQGAAVLPLDLRMVSTSDTLVNSAGTRLNADIYKKGDWYLEFRRTFGSSIVCERRTTSPVDTITLYPKAVTLYKADGVTPMGIFDGLSSWGIPPQPGDSILILDDWTMVGPGDDRWQAYEVLKVTPVTGLNGCPWKNKTAGDSTSLLYLADTSRASFKIAIKGKLGTGDDLSKTVIVGAPVRFFRRVRYEIYSPGDEQWYLGYSDCLPGYTTWNKCSEVTPVAGPYRPHTGQTTENGIVFVYYDSLGNKLAYTDESRRISRVEVIMRTETANAVTRTGAGKGEKYRDSLVFTVGVRNRR